MFTLKMYHVVSKVPEQQFLELASRVAVKDKKW